jgi:hypothetical protein
MRFRWRSCSERVTWRFDAARRGLTRNGVPVQAGSFAGARFALAPEGAVLEVKLERAGAPGQPVRIGLPMPPALRGAGGWTFQPEHIARVRSPEVSLVNGSLVP